MKHKLNVIGAAAVAFGAGLLLATFIPCIVLVCIEAAIIVFAGVLLFAK